MPRDRTNGYYKDEKDFIVFVFWDECTKEFYVGCAAPTNIKQIYSKHYNLKNKKTNLFFERARRANYKPRMYRLEQIHTPRSVVYKHRLAWAKYFLDRGFCCIGAKSFLENVKDLDDDSKCIFAGIADIPVEEIFCIDNDLMKYSERKKSIDCETEKYKKNERRYQINLSFTPDQFEIVKHNAAKSGTTLSKYARELLLRNGKRVEVDFSKLDENLKIINEEKKLLRQLLYTIHKTGRYYEEDLEFIQRIIDRTIKEERKIMRRESKIMHEILESFAIK